MQLAYRLLTEQGSRLKHAAICKLFWSNVNHHAHGITAFASAARFQMGDVDYAKRDNQNKPLYDPLKRAQHPYTAGCALCAHCVSLYVLDYLCGRLLFAIVSTFVYHSIKLLFRWFEI